MANVWFLGQIYMDDSQTYSVASAPAVTGSVFKQIFRLFLGQSNLLYTSAVQRHILNGY